MRRAALASSFLSFFASGLLAGCPDRSISEVDPAQGRVEAKDIPINVNRKIDMLFLIDDSPSMKDKQDNLAANFPKFINVLKTIPGGLPDVHIAVVTSDLGTRATDGSIAPQIGNPGSGGCSGAGKAGEMQLFGATVTGGRYISDILDPAKTDGSRIRNYTFMNDDSLSNTFSQMAKAGAGGCGFEQHLEAVKQALLPDPDPATNPTKSPEIPKIKVNQGFLRNDAYLAVIIIADEDDCSMIDTKTMLGPDSTVMGSRQSFRCTRFGVICDTNGPTPNAMNVVGPKERCHPNDNNNPQDKYLEKVSTYVDFLKSLKADPKKVIVAGIMGTTTPFAVELRPPNKNAEPIPALAHSCTYIGADINGDGVPDPEVADPPIRMQFFLDQFPNRSTFVSICQKDLSGGLAQIGDLLKTVIGDPCIEGKLADVDPNTAGLQYDCSVSSVNNPNTAMQSETVMPQCNPPDGTGATSVCWHLVADPANCQKADPTSPHLALKIELQDTLPKDSHIIANCVTEVTNN